MQANTDLMRIMYMHISHGQLKPIHGGHALKHEGDKYVYCRTTKDRIVRKKGVVKEVYSPTRKRFLRTDKLDPGEKVDLKRPFTIEDLAPGVYDYLRNQEFAFVYAHLLPETPRPPSPPVPRPLPPPVSVPSTPRREAFVPQPVPADIAAIEEMRDPNALRCDMTEDLDRLWQMELSGSI